MDAIWREVVNDPAKLDGIVNAMSKCMAKMLSLKNTDIDNGRVTLGQSLYEEKEHFPTREQLNELEQIQRAQRFVQRAHSLAECLRSKSEQVPNVVLTPYGKEETYCHAWLFQRPRDDGTESTLRVGGLRASIFQDVFKRVLQWLVDCDRVMNIAFSEAAHEPDHAPEQLLEFNTFLTELARNIASRLTLKPEDGDDDGLSTGALQSRANKAAAHTSLRAEEAQRTDLVALHTFEALARKGPLTPAGVDIIQNKLAHIQYIVRAPPLELGLSGANAQHMNLALLERACDPTLDPDVRIKMIRSWHECHGGCAATAAQQAVQKLRMWKERDAGKAPFIKVLCSNNGLAPKNAMNVPAMPFVHTDQQRWKFAVKTPERTSFDWIGRRYVRITSLVLELLAWGALERGVVSSANVVGPVATRAVFEAQVVYQLLKIKENSFQLGTRLLRFCEDVTDAESHMADQVAETILYVSNFSMLELLAVFSPQSPAMRVIIGEFTRRTRDNLTFRMPSEYIGFACDAMAVLLPIIRARRERAGITLLQRVNPICELLKMVPRVRGWTPLQGCLRLEQKDLKSAPAVLYNVLKQLAERQLLVEYKRPFLGKGQIAAKKAFVFDNAQLVAVLSGYTLCSRREKLS